MVSGADNGVWPAAVLAALSVDTLVHPIDTLITRIQSPGFATQYKTPAGRTDAALFRGLYQGFGPTIIAGLPASAGFWTVYEALKCVSEDAKAKGHLRHVPVPLLHAASSAVGELVSCAIMSPAEVLKQNAQVHTAHKGNHTVAVLKKFITRPARLWAGYSMMVAGYLPGTSITMALYEHIKTRMLATRVSRDANMTDSLWTQFSIAGTSAGIAAGFTSCLLVPIDVIKTRMRLLAGEATTAVRAPPISFTSGVGSMCPATWQTPRKITFYTVAKETLRVEGLPGLFRGIGLTCLAATFSSVIYFGVYECTKTYIRNGTGRGAGVVAARDSEVNMG